MTEFDREWDDAAAAAAFKAGHKRDAEPGVWSICATGRPVHGDALSGRGVQATSHPFSRVGGTRTAECITGDRANRIGPAIGVFIAAVLATLIVSGPALAQCSSPDAGDWVNLKPGGDPAQIEVYFAQCGDTPGAETRLGVKVFVRQSSGRLYLRPAVSARYVRNNGKTWLFAKVPTGGYVDEMFMRRVLDPKNQVLLRVGIRHQSLDSKPSSVDWYDYRRR